MIYRDYWFGGTGNAFLLRWIGFSENASPARTDAKAVAEDARWSQRIGRICQRVEDNALHLRRIGFFENNLDQSRNKNVLELFQKFG